MSKITVHRLAKGGLQNWKTDGLFSHDTNGKEKGGEGKVITAAVIIPTILSTYCMPGADLSAKNRKKKKKETKNPHAQCFHLLLKGAANAVVPWKGNFAMASMAFKSVPVIGPCSFFQKRKQNKHKDFSHKEVRHWLRTARNLETHLVSSGRFT